MTKRHFEAIAAIIREERARAFAGDFGQAPERVDSALVAIGSIKERLANLAMDENPRFNRGRFYAACVAD